MKKNYLWIVICFVLFFGLSGCQYLNTKDNKYTDNEDLPVILVGGTIYEPYFYRDIDSNYDGIDVELAREAFSRMGYHPEFVAVDISELGKALEDGTIDCIWSCYTKETREDDYLWAGQYLYTRRVVAVKSGSEIQSLEELEGKTIAVQANSTVEKIFLYNMSPDIPQNYELQTYRTIAESFTALRKNYVDAVGSHEATLLQYTSEYPGEYRYLNLSLNRSKLGVAFRKDADKAVADTLTQTLQEMSEDGTIQQVLEDYHLDVSTNLYGGTK